MRPLSVGVILLACCATALGGGGPRHPKDDPSVRTNAAEESRSAAVADSTAPDDSPYPTEPGVFETPDAAGLASSQTVLAFDRRTGDVIRIIHLANGQDFACAQREPLFSISLVQPPNGNVSVNAHSFGQVDVRNADARTLTLIFDRHPELDLSARVTARVDDAGKIRLHIAVRNETDLAVESVQFPRMPWRPVLGADAVDDRLLVPWRDSGELIVSPGVRTIWQKSDYPGLVCAQFAAYYDGAAGVYLATEDGNGSPKDWSLHCRSGRKVELNVIHRFEEVRGTDAALAYDVVVRTFQGDWRDAAAIYKSWAVRQPWCARKLVDRADVPRFLKEGTGVIIHPGFRDDDHVLKTFGKDLERLPDFVSAYRRRTGLAHILFVPYGWENRGTWAGIHYYPARPSNEAWAKAAERLRANGDLLMFMPSGFWWVVKRQASENGPAFDDSDLIETYRPMLAKNADGRPCMMDCYDLSRQPRQSWRGISMHLCHGSDQARRTIQEVFLHAARFGCSIISFDQEQGGRQYAPCYDMTHGHGAGYGQYMWTGFEKTCEAILAEGREINHELGLCMENTSELAIPWMATYWSRQFRGGFREEDSLPAGVEQSVGLFSYLYHEYTTAIGAACTQGQGAMGRRPSAEVRCLILSNNLCRGLIPGPFVHDVPLEPADDWQATVSRAFFSYCRPYTRFSAYLLLGETVRPPKIECREVEGWAPVETDQAGPQPSQRATPTDTRAILRFPAINSGGFKAADGSIGTILANTTDKEQAASLVIPWRTNQLALYDSDRTELRRWQNVSPEQEIRVVIEPFGTRMLIAD